MKTLKLLLSFFSILITISCSESINQRISLSNLKCEMLTNPVGIDCEKPNLSWEIVSEEHGVAQTSYHIIVSSSEEKLEANNGDLWNSGWVNSSESLYIPYEGVQLESHTKYFWKVRVKTNKGLSEWSEVATWRVGLLNDEEWQAQWIGLDRGFEGDILVGNTRLAARYLRKEFEVDKPIKEAMLYIAGLGLFEAYVNGERVGTQVLSPTPTGYDKSVRYNSFEVTEFLNQGENTIGTVLGNGRYFAMRNPGNRHFGFPKMRAQLEIVYEDNSRQTLISDTSWKICAQGPIRVNNEFDGEEYDARMEMDGWNKTGFNENSDWMIAEIVDAPMGKLSTQTNLNIEIMETIYPIKISSPKAGMYILDMGQNMVGWLKFKLKGEKGSVVKMRFAELLKSDGTLYMDNLRGALVTDKYTFKGEEVETWEPSFVYHGFRYVEITGLDKAPELKDFEGKVIYDKMDITGSFETSNKTINQIYKNAYWGIRGNYRGMPTDCPQRDERMGWLGDRAAGSQGESYMFDNNLLYAKWMNDIEESQRESGSLSDVCPNYWEVYSDNMTWPGAYVIVADMLYERFGNKAPIQKHYQSMKKWLDHMASNYLVDNIMTKDTYGDWCMPPESLELIHSEDPNRKTNGALISTSYYYRLLLLMEKFAKILDLNDEAEQFTVRAEQVKKAYNDKFFDKENTQYDNNTVTANLLSLMHEMVPEGYDGKVFDVIIEKMENEHNNHVSTGLVGIQWLMRGLSDYGRTDLAYQLATHTDYPSWGYMADRGATTIWELWNGDTANPEMNSNNHVMLLGDLVIWYYEYLAGIRSEEGGYAFKKIRMKPHVVDGLDYVNASYKSVRGLIKSEWTKDDSQFRWTIEIPANTTATVYVPAKKREDVKEDKALSKFIRFVAMDGDYAVYEVQSGRYEFSSIL